MQIRRPNYNRTRILQCHCSGGINSRLRSRQIKTPSRRIHLGSIKFLLQQDRYTEQRHCGIALQDLHVHLICQRQGTGIEGYDGVDCGIEGLKAGYKGGYEPCTCCQPGEEGIVNVVNGSLTAVERIKGGDAPLATRSATITLRQMNCITSP
jgi:hypothetical protein